MKAHVTRTGQLEWTPLAEAGVRTEGIPVKVLRFDETQSRPPTFLLRFEAGASYPHHNHPGGEEVYVLEGKVRFGFARATTCTRRPTRRTRYTRRPDARCCSWSRKRSRC